MKRIFYIAAALVSLAACNKVTVTQAPEDHPTKQERCSVTVNVTTGQQTKVAYQTGSPSSVDNTIANFQVLVFDNGVIDSYGYKNGSDTLNISCTSGEKTIYVVTNCGESLKNIKTLSELESTGIDIADTRSNALPMVQKRTVSLPSEEPVTFTVKRLQSRVILECITFDFLTQALKSADITLVKVFLNHVPKKNTLKNDDSYTPDAWYNNDGYMESGLSEDLSKMFRDNVDSKAENGVSYTSIHAFYPMPTIKSTKTMHLVIECKIDGTVYYYPIEVPGLKANESCTVTNLKIKRRGSDDPDEPVSFEDIEYEVVKVADWDTTHDYGELEI